MNNGFIEITDALKDFRDNHQPKLKLAQIASLFLEHGMAERRRVYSKKFFVIVPLFTSEKLNVINFNNAPRILNAYINGEPSHTPPTYWKRDWYEEKASSLNEILMKNQNLDEPAVDDILFADLLYALAVHEAANAPAYRSGNQINMKAIAEKWHCQFETMCHTGVNGFELRGLSPETIRKKLSAAYENSKNKSCIIK